MDVSKFLSIPPNPSVRRLNGLSPDTCTRENPVKTHIRGPRVQTRLQITRCGDAELIPAENYPICGRTPRASKKLPIRSGSSTGSQEKRTSLVSLALPEEHIMRIFRIRDADKDKMKRTKTQPKARQRTGSYFCRR